MLNAFHIKANELFPCDRGMNLSHPPEPWASSGPWGSPYSITTEPVAAKAAVVGPLVVMEVAVAVVGSSGGRVKWLQSKWECVNAALTRLPVTNGYVQWVLGPPNSAAGPTPKFQ